MHGLDKEKKKDYSLLKMKKIMMFLAAVFFFLLSGAPLLAAGFQLKNIGGLSTAGKLYDHWWYANGNITFTGEGVAGSQVEATIDGTTETVSVSEAGQWSYTPAPLANGDHQVSFASQGSTVAFTLTIGGEMPAGVGAPAEATTPVVGNFAPTQILFISGGLFLLTSSLLLWAKKEEKSF